MEAIGVMVTITYSPDRIIVPSNWAFDLGAELIQTVTVEGTVEQVTIGDAIFNRETAATVRKDAQLIAPFGAVFTSLDTDIATVNASGLVQSVGTGSVGILARYNSAIRRYDFTAGANGGQTVDTFASYVAESVGETINQETDALLDGELAIYSAVNDGAGEYTRNTACWAAGIDLTAIPVWNSVRGSRANGIAITSRHVLHASHVSVGIGATLRFVTNGNVVVTRTITAIDDVGIDLQIATLDSDLPETITPAKVLPADWQDDLTIGSIPLVCADQSRGIFVRDTTAYYESNGTRIISHELSQSAARADYTEPIITGDSGAAIGVILNGELLAIGTHYSATACPMLSSYSTEINAILAATSKSLTAVTL